MNTYLIYVLAAGFTGLVSLIMWLGFGIIKGRRIEASYENQLQEIVAAQDEDDIVERDRGRNLVERWNLYWMKVAKVTGVKRWQDKDSPAGKDFAMIGGALFLTVALVTRNPIVAILCTVLPIFLISMWLKMKYDKQSEVIQDQLPGFLFALKSNIQANETPVRAILKVVDNMPEPLRTDLNIVKQKILANASFAEALEAMAQKTNSAELKFLAACLIQAASTGANIEPQINTIQRVLEQRKAASDELNKAVKATLPSIYISSFAIPGSFFASYFLDTNARGFWFKDVLSYVVLAIVIALWGIGMFLSRKMVQSIKNL